MSAARPPPPRHWQLLLAVNLVVFGGWAVGPFLAAGTWRWPECWAYFAVLVVAQLAHGAYVAKKNPELRLHRRSLGEGTKGWDVAWNLLFWPQVAAAPVVAGFGVRLGWPQAPWPLFAAGVGLCASGMALSARAMAVNPHFEGTVRIQHDRGHRVIDQGPYRVIRHPGYVGLALWVLGGPFLLRSWAALAPAGAVLLWLVLRTALEDALLRRELSGYADYAARVRWRWLPGVW